ncbi:uncharacterized protein LOC133281009 [Pezoporus flaviventris]|uniref:uncharacterized protein LOC133281009 n=1 Tax=Pezoporus flaviventris TaxID=889875 RepID=UPI002AB04845|nr:uncharacterized protein LOC133281009 [Pezoporus flaviventris]
MGSSFSRQMFCVPCGRCLKQEEANEEISETKPILQASGGPSLCVGTPPPAPALQVSKQDSEEVQSLSQDAQPSADAVEENMEPSSAADAMGMTEGWEGAWGSTGFLVALEDGESKGEAEVLTQAGNQKEGEQVGNREEKIKPVPGASELQVVAPTTRDAELVGASEQPDEQAGAGSKVSPSALPGNSLPFVLSFKEILSETATGQDCEPKPPAGTAESLIERNLPPCAVRMAEETDTDLSAEHVEEPERTKLAEVSPQTAERTELPPLVEVETASPPPMQAARETADALAIPAEMNSASAMPWESLCPEGASLEPANQLLDFLEQVTQSTMGTAEEMESLCRAQPAEQSGVLCFHELEDEHRGCDTETAAREAEPQQQAELPAEPVTCVQIPVKQDAGFLNVTPSLSEEPGSSGEREAENVEA